ncbi:gamma-glutamyl-phosphate reductase [Actinobacillus succinogenes]|uniref:Gamma-glutamyl phosphate reductase n=1 Tax=Actinobacillus succinogenes (strain ATCC 55618 / DSM 22257 / CCUG 43843 / 130Z) TaxID=339671 RepID=PROA_ACTSZ|nr:glutamate-5-semialdehyde dehydrogenase [Actinobacillus succinogenes]A6VMV2.1 RecName: Full=Gamma-glutamyl phosphate reductase; Short=GPR; AltName: Full=Glutamate-5-semialdehyde dehydrogenase; AltName: Full=Glutamyl-gamma-semialdehyde dehydrogenase; Short=GSA dehydrogenase [Actinobacillus succinogenes 130Z]ABR74299.1 gamma-glutamyl phosphate reductase [Actinobacillus succinogenes 130Z]PHI39276.1 gamma-glutamyl-phosphate reductase [Actinobacillus succinogenes]
MTNLEVMGKAARQAAFELSQLSAGDKNYALQMIAEQLESQQQQILAANARDIDEARINGLNDAIIDRLLLTPERLRGIANDVRHVISLADPVGKLIDGGILDSGLKLERIRVPVGVIGTIYEARPNVTIDVASLCLKTGNAVILRGGKETRHSNRILVEVVQNALEKAGLPKTAVQAITDPDRALVMELLKLDRYVDMIIPRGGAGLHALCKQHATIPVIIGGIGVCHTFVEQSADQNRAISVIKNAKTQRPSTCNTLETLLIQESIAHEFLPKLAAELPVKYYADKTAYSILHHAGAEVLAVTEDDLRKEWLCTNLNVVIVQDIEAAVAHIREYGSQHSEAILTESLQLARRFVAQVDSAAVYVNASTRFTDGGQFGLGAEVAVSTQKLHARGPMGLEALTTYKWVATGDYTVRS